MRKGKNGMSEKNYVVAVQCDQVVHETCPGFLCEHAFNARKDAFAPYAGREMRYISISCGGCPGRGTERKLINLAKNLKKRESVEKDRVIVHLSTCIARSSHHGPRCPHIDYIKGQIERAGFDWVEGTRYSPTAEKRRAEGLYS